MKNNEMEVNRVILGDALQIMRTWPDQCVNCCVTSPPYWGLRDYGVDGQLGLEKTPEEYVVKMVEIFAEIKRVLREDGTLWLNMGDSYCAAQGGRQSAAGKLPQKTVQIGKGPKSRSDVDVSGWSDRDMTEKIIPTEASGLKPKDLCGIPWMVAFALRQDGWYLRQDIIWHKPNPMPESVQDRCTKAHEYIFLLSKKAKYYYDQDAIREPYKQSSINRAQYRAGERKSGVTVPDTDKRWNVDPDSHSASLSGANKRSVWTVPTKSYSEAHFATFPPDLIEPCILAGCPENVCKKCGKPRGRITESEQIKRRRKTPVTKPCDERSPSANDVAGVEVKTTGWTDCGCNAGFRPGIVLDPFAGTNTTGMVAYNNRRDYIGIELNAEYIKLDRGQKAQDSLGLFQ